MIRVTVELIPYGFGKPRKLGEMTITNDGVTSMNTEGQKGSYDFVISGKRIVMKSGRVENWSRQSKHVWRLVGKCLKEGGYV